MKQATLALLALLLCSASQAQNVRTVPAAMPPVSAGLAAGAVLSRPSFAPSAPLSGAAQLSLTPSLGLPSPVLQAPAAAARASVLAVAPAAKAVPSEAQAAVPAQALKAANAILSALPAAKPLQAGAQASAPAAEQGQPTAMASLSEAADPRRAGRSVEAASSALFDGAKAQAEPKEWTFMVFLNGHNNLDPYGEMNIKQMEKVGSNDRVNIVVQWASLGKPTKRMLIQRSAGGAVSSPVIEELPAVDMGSADQLLEFIRWTVERFPAAHYMVDLWDHGAGWHLKKRGPGEANPHDISWDDQTGSFITTEQLGSVMRKAKDFIGRPIDVLGFDACLMAMAEVMAEVAGSVRYLAGSEQTEPGAGWPYEKVLQQWLSAGQDDGAALVKAITEQFVAAYRRNVTFSGVDLEKFPAFVEAAKAFAKELAGLDDKRFAQARKAAQATRRYAYADYGDFVDFVQRLSAVSGGLATAPAVLAAYQAMVVASAASSDMEGSNGMSVWLPTSAYNWKEYGARYLGLVWHALSEWGEFARRLAGARATDAAD